MSLDESEEDETLALETEEQEVGEVKSFKYGTRLRSKGCVQHDEYEWTVHKEDYSLNDYTLAITCRDIWKTKQKDVPCSLVVRLEVENKTAVSIDIYSLIRTKIETRFKLDLPSGSLHRSSYHSARPVHL